MNTKPVILLVSARKEELDPFFQGLQANDSVSAVRVGTNEEALKASSDKGAALVVIDGSTEEDSGLELTRALLKMNAFIYTAILSDMDEALFHDESEGLGILAQLPLNPDSDHAGRLLLQLGQLMGGL